MSETRAPVQGTAGAVCPPIRVYPLRPADERQLPRNQIMLSFLRLLRVCHWAVAQSSRATLRITMAQPNTPVVARTAAMTKAQ